MKISDNPQQITEPTIPAVPKRKRRRVRSQRGSIVRRGNSWMAVYRTKEGRQKWVTFHSRSEATRHLTDNIKLISDDKFVDAKPELFSVYAERWLARFARRVKPSTYSTYRSIFHRWLTPKFGDVEMRDIRREDVRAFVHGLIEKGDLAGKSIDFVRGRLKELFDSAIEDQVASTNPAYRLKVKLPDDSTERQAPPRGDVDRTWAQLDHHPVAQAVLACGAMTGMRIGEMLGLFWDDLDFRRATIRVERTLTRANRKTHEGVFCKIEWVWSETLALVPPKTKKGKRVIAMPEPLAGILRRVHACAPNAESPYLFQDGPDGGPVHPKKIRAALAEAQDRAGVKRFTPHALRHLYESELIEAGASPVGVRDSMGHASLHMMNRYAHAVGDGRAHAASVAGVFQFPVRKLLEEQNPSR